MNRQPRLITNPHLKLPVLSPRFFLLVLANLDQNLILTLFQFSFADELVDRVTVVINLIGHHKLSVEPNFGRVRGSDSKLSRTGF